MHHGLVVKAKPILRPSKTVDDIACIGLCRDGLLDHLKRRIELFTAIHQSIAHIVQHLKLIGRQLQGTIKITHRRRPISQPVMRCASDIMQIPMPPRRLINQGNRPVIAAHRARILLILA